jgi:hypothetical protein
MEVSLVGVGVAIQAVDTLRWRSAHYMAEQLLANASYGMHYLRGDADMAKFLDKFVLELAECMHSASSSGLRPAQKAALVGSVPPEFRSGTPDVLLVPRSDKRARLSADLLIAVAEGLGAGALAPRVAEVDETFASVLSVIERIEATSINPLGWLVSRPEYSEGSSFFSFLNGLRVGIVLQLVQEAGKRGWGITIPTAVS